MFNLEKLLGLNKKSNVVKVESKGTPKYEPRLKDMREGQIGYTVPWAYNPRTKELNLNFCFISLPRGTSSMPVQKKDNKFIVDLDFDYFGEKYEF